MRLSRISTSFVIMAALASAAIAASHADPIKEREAHMKAYGQQLRILGGMAQDRAPYDAAAAAAAANQLAEIASRDESGFWIAGTDTTSGADTRALPAIWENMDDFNAKIAALQTATVALAAVAGDGLDAMKAGFAPVGAACGDCHRTYRAEE